MENMKARVMKRAWTEARNAVKRFGGTAMQYMSDSLKLAWALVKMQAIIDKENEMEKESYNNYRYDWTAKLWEKGTHSRIYLAMWRNRKNGRGTSKKYDFGFINYKTMAYVEGDKNLYNYYKTVCA